jgi:hypothetical protein
MATIFRRLKGEPVADHLNGQGRERLLTTVEMMGEAVAACTFCGESGASGYWRGAAGNVSCCPACAAAILPKLAADALVGEYGHLPQTYARLCRSLVEISRSYWQAGLAAVSRCVAAKAKADDHAACGAGCPVQAGRRLSNGSN